MSWKEFEEHAPKMAALGIERLNRKVAYLAILNKDGSPRLHPVTPFIGNGMLFIFTEPSSPKIRDLRRDGRYALHCSVDRKEGEPLIEFLVSGTAKIISDSLVRAKAVSFAASPVVTDDYVLFEFRIDNALVIEYDDGKRTVQRWHLHAPSQDGKIITVDGGAGTVELKLRRRPAFTPPSQRKSSEMKSSKRTTMNRTKKQLYILCDMEGASQISPDNKQALHYGSDLWRKEGRGFVTSDVKAVCEAANEFGIDEIVINDEHDYGNRTTNLLVDQLPRNIRMVRRPHLPDTPRKMVQKDPFGIIIVGQHAKYGGGGFAPHTIQSPPIAEVTLNSLKVGEIGLELALFMGVKFLAIVGEEAATKEARELCPNVVTVPVKSLEKNWFPTAGENYPIIKEKVIQALKQREAADCFHLDPPYRFSLKLTEDYHFDPRKRFLLRWLAKLFFFEMDRGRMNLQEAFWETKKMVSGLYGLQSTRGFISKRTQN
jgi:D-amino peptidase